MKGMGQFPLHLQSRSVLYALDSVRLFRTNLAVAQNHTFSALLSHSLL